MRTFLLSTFLLLTFSSAASAKCSWDGHETVSDCPADVTNFLQDEAICRHFIGEQTGGENPERDAEVQAGMTKYCDKYSSDDVIAITDKYRGKPDVYFGLLDSYHRIDAEALLEMLRAQKLSCHN